MASFNPLMTKMVMDAKRTTRRPQHRFNLITRPWQIQPFLLAPVLPGETMKNLLHQSRTVSKPLKNALVGWWNEYYYFYVKLRDLAARDTWSAMLLNPELDVSAQNAAADVPTYHYAGYPNFAQQCLVEVVENYFRDEGEAWNTYLIGTLPAASIGQKSFLDSVITAADQTEDDFSIDLDASGTVATIMASEVDQAMRLYELLQAGKLTTMTFEDFLATYGVKPNAAESHIPELIRYVRDWTYPTNTVEPTTGTPSTAASWSVTERADKDRFFREPGFIFGVTVARPKVYLSRLKGSAADLMNSAMRWIPAGIIDEGRASMMRLLDNTGPLGDNTDANGAWIDLRDLLSYGDQFVNVAFTGALSEVALPTIAMQKNYPTSTDADALFAAASPANTLATDGICSLTIATRIRDVTETSINVR